MRRSLVVAAVVGIALAAAAASKPKIVSFGHWMTVKWMVGPSEQTPRELKVRALMVNNEAKEFTIGELHDVTDRAFVVQRAVRVNDALPDDRPAVARWKWQP